MAGSYTWSDLRGADLNWILDLNVQGQIYRFSTKSMSFTDDSGSMHRYTPGLETLEVEDRAALPGETLGDLEASITILFSTDSGGGWSSLVSSSFSFLGQSTGELSLIREGDSWDRRQIVISGSIASASWGAFGEPVQLSLSASPWQGEGTRSQLPGSTAVCSSFTWPRSTSSGVQLGDGMDGQVYPFVWGSPGFRGPRGLSGYHGWPALLVEINSSDLTNLNTDAIVLVAGHPTVSTGGSNRVRLWNVDGTGTIKTAGVLLTPQLVRDDLGRTVTIVSVPHSAGTIADGHELWCTFETETQGGFPSDVTTDQAMRAAPEIISYLLKAGSIRADTDQIRSLYLPGFLLDGWINEVTDPLDVILDDLLSLLPVSMRIGADGLQLLKVPLQATASRAIAHIDPSIYGGSRASAVQLTDPANVSNKLTLEFAYKASGDSRYLGRRVYAPSRLSADGEADVSPYLQASESVYGLKEASPEASDWIMSSSTAQSVLDWKTRWLSTVKAQVTYLLPQEYQSLQPMDLVTITDNDLSWSSVPAIVVSVLRAPGPTVLELLIFPDLIRDSPTY